MASEKRVLLIVDDDAALRRVFRRMFEKDFTVVEAAGGAQCLQVLEQVTPAAIVTDCRMPGPTGMELARAVRQLLPSTPLISWSGNHTSGQREQFLEVGYDACIDKVCELEDLRHTLRSFLEREQRVSYRQRMRFLVAAAEGDEVELFYTHDASESGVFIAACSSPERGSLLQLEIFVEVEHRVVRAQADARVVWCREHGEEAAPPGFAVELVGMSDEARELWRRALRRTAP